MHRQGNMGSSGGPNDGGGDAVGDFQVYVGNLDPNVNPKMMLAVFRKFFPSSYDAKIITDPVTKNSKGFGFIKLGS